MISISVDVSQAKAFLEKGRHGAGEQVRSLSLWAQRFVKEGLEGLASPMKRVQSQGWDLA